MRRSGLFIGIASGATVCAEVLFTRLFSVSTWYGLAFLVLSLGMLGLAAGALRARDRSLEATAFVARELLRLGVGLIAATVVICAAPLTFGLDLASFTVVLVVAFAITVPMSAGGAIIARVLGEGQSIGALYGIDLACAALGALAPLVLLGPMSVPTALLALGCLAIAASMVAGTSSPSPSRRIAGVTLALALGMTALTHARGSLHVRWPKGLPAIEEPKPAFESWSSLAHVTLTPFSKAPFPMWSAGTAFKPAQHEVDVALALIDGDAATMAYAYDDGDLKALRALELDATNTAHALRPKGRACVIGIGGGRDLEAALLFGHDEVVGFEINPAMVAMLESVRSRSPVLSDPRVHVRIGDGRTELARSGLACNVLQASLVDTWAATSAGAFAHTEATLYTREAWKLFLDRVEPDGILTFSRWYEPTRISETARLVSLAVAALLDRGAADPSRHLALVAGPPVATILVSPAPFSDEDLRKLQRHAQQLGVQIAFMPGKTTDDPILAELVATKRVADLAAAGLPRKIDTSPPTDDRPFFFHLIAPSAWLSPLETIEAAKNQHGAYAGNLAAGLVLLATLIASLAVALVLLWPALKERATLPGNRPVIYFACLGAGFMIAELALVQRLHVVLGHPTHALAFVLAGLLVATGAGSALSERIVTTEVRVVRVAQLAGLVLLALPYAVIDPLAKATALSTLGTRAAWTFGVSALCGFALGMLFPSALRFAGHDGAPLALAVNGVAAVLGSVACVLVSVWFGIPSAFFLAALLYGVAAICGPTRWARGT